MEFKLNNLESVIDVSQIANIHFFEFPTGYKTLADKHSFCELIFVVSGIIQVDSEEFNGELKKNNLIIHTANCTHALSCPNSCKTSVIIIGFKCTLDKLFDFAKRPITLNDEEIKRLADIIKEGRNVFAPPYDVPVYNMKKKKKQVYGAEQALRASLELFLIGLLRKYKFREKTIENEKIGFDIKELLNYIDNNFLEKISLDELSFLFHTNRSTLCKEFKASTGKTIISYIIDKKIDLIKNELTFSNKSLTDMSDELGFDSLPQFSTFVSKHLGMSALKYRQQYSKAEDL